MGTMTYAEMQTELTYYLEGRTITAARLGRWINQAYRFLSYPNVHKHWELESTVEVPLVADQFVYPLDTSQAYVTTEILGVRGARYIASTTDSFIQRRTRLGATSIGWFNKQTHTVGGGGPQRYGIFRKSLVVSPGPNSTIAGNLVVLEVWTQPAALAADGDVTVLLEWWDEAVLLGAKWIGEAALGFTEYAEQSKQTFISFIQGTPLREFTGSDDEESYFPDMESGEPLTARN